uniref:Fuzzy planar cell polarity protein n=1 Tax=Panthera tigris altaica TaxID=74533 RepID=A0A8C9JLG0_PANTA
MGEEGTEGTVHLLCLAASSGVPLFCRSSRGGPPARQQLPFSVIGSLNGVHMFGQNLEVQLSSARTEDTTVVLLVGLEELTNIRNVERLKKELRASYRLVDSFLGDSERIGDLTQCVDCVVPPEVSLLQEALSGFAEAAGTAFGSLVVSGRVVAATESWWRLGTPEAVLLPWLVGSLPPQAARDYPPRPSFALIPSLVPSVLRPRGPLLSSLPTPPPLLLDRWWQPVLDPLRTCVPLGPRALPAGFPLHVDGLVGRVGWGALIPSSPDRDTPFLAEPSPEQRRRLLRSFYSLVTATHFPPEPGTPEDKVEDAAQRAQVPRACYLVSGPEEPGTGWRLVALQLGPRRLLLLVSAQSPTHGLRSLATHTLHALTPLL